MQLHLAAHLCCINTLESLRAHLLATVAELKHNPDRLLIFIDNGKIRCTPAGHPHRRRRPSGQRHAAPARQAEAQPIELMENLDKPPDGIKLRNVLYDTPYEVHISAISGDCLFLLDNHREYSSYEDRMIFS